ncbi:MAG: procyclic acidic repetitive family protein [Lachnospiraceae bacterium]|nr:procyclic acidic repetitive family protein [Lachnospiraceae bacterium]
MRFSARNYKYSFRDQLMIYEQKPDATACASRDQWEMNLDRSIKEDAQEIALLDESGNSPEIHYVYDVTDTDGDDAREIGLFVMKPAYRTLIHKKLTEAFQIKQEETMEDAILRVSLTLACDHWDENRDQLIGTLRQAFPEDATVKDIATTYVALMAQSAAYSLMTRLTDNPDKVIRMEGFDAVSIFNSNAAAYALGIAVNSVTVRVFREIMMSVRSYEKTKRQQVASEATDEKEARIIETKTVTEPEMKPEAETEPKAELETEPMPESIAEPEPDPTPLPESVTEPEPDLTPPPEPVAEPEPDPLPEPASESQEDNQAEQAPEPEPEPDQVPEEKPEPPQNLRTIAIIGSSLTKEDIESVDREYPVVLEISPVEFDRILTKGTLSEWGKERVREFFDAQPDLQKRIRFLMSEFGVGGRNWVLPGNIGAYIDYCSKGITIWRYRDSQEVRYGWEEVANRIDQLLSQGRYLPVEKQDQPIRITSVDEKHTEQTKLRDTIPQPVFQLPIPVRPMAANAKVVGRDV